MVKDLSRFSSFLLSEGFSPTFRKADNDKQVTSDWVSHTKEHEVKPSNEQGRAIHNYTTSNKRISSQDKQHIDNYLNSNRTKKDMVVFRGLAQSPHHEFEKQGNPGSITHKSSEHTSATSSYHVARQFARNDSEYDQKHLPKKMQGENQPTTLHFMRIHVKQGTAAARIDQHSEFNSSDKKGESQAKITGRGGGEHEVLFHRNTKFTIHDKPTTHTKIHGHGAFGRTVRHVVWDATAEDDNG